MSEQLTVRPKASTQLAQLIGMEPGAMLEAIKAQCFKGNAANITDSQLAAFVSIAAEMGVNPFLPDMLYAFPGSGGSIIPIMGPSGVYKKLMEHPSVDSWETTVYPEDVSLPPTHATTKIWRNGSERPLVYTALVSEWRTSQNPNWANRPRHMIGLRSLKHCARQIIHGIPYDADDREIMEGPINVTPATESAEAPARPAPPPRAKKGIAAVQENPKPAEKVIDVETTAVPPAPEPKPVPVAEPPKIEEAKRPAPPPAPVAVTKSGPRTSLADKEQFTARCTVEKVYALIVSVAGEPTPSVQAQVKGEFVGTVLHFDGATKAGDELVPRPAWKEGSEVSLDLLGRMNNKSGKVLTVVSAIRGASQETPAVEVE